MIGAGPAGLSAARHLRTFGIQVVDQFNYGQYGGVDPAQKGYYFQLQVYERIGISLVEVCERIRKSVISVGKVT